MAEDERIRVLLVDDEPPARDGLRDLLDKDSRFVVVGECGDGQTAVEQIKQLKPDLVFLDIQMPEMNGFEVIRAVGDEMPAMVIVTAFDQFAIRAFEHHAIGYILKPISPARFEVTLDRAVQWIRGKCANQQVFRLQNLLNELKEGFFSPERIVVKTYNGVLHLPPNELDWIEAAGNYVKFHLEDKEYLVRESLTHFIEKLDKNLFARIHRSHIVNIEHVRESFPSSCGSDYFVILSNGIKLPVGRTYKDAVSFLLKSS